MIEKIVVIGSAPNPDDFTEIRRKSIENYLRSQGFEDARVIRKIDRLTVWGQRLIDVLDSLHEGTRTRSEQYQEIVREETAWRS